MGLFHYTTYSNGDTLMTSGDILGKSKNHMLHVH